jgi:MFS family permease
MVYFTTLIFVTLFIMAKALATNYGAALAFRFVGALFAAAPMTVAGGTIGDIWKPMQIPFGLPLMTIAAYSGPILGPVIGAYTPQIGYVWADWITTIIAGATLVIVLLAEPETFSPLLLEWRAKHLRDLTGDDRYQADHALTGSLSTRLLQNVSRSFMMIWTEPIILVFSFYPVLLYFVLFTFLNGYPFIFGKVYGISTSLTFTIFVAMIPGIIVALCMVPLMYSLAKKAARKAEAEGKNLQPEVSLYWAMAGGSILMPISLFWMAYTCYVRLHFESLVPLSLTSYTSAKHQHLATDRSIRSLWLLSGLHLHHDLYVHHLRIPTVCGLSPGIHDLLALCHLRGLEPCVSQDVRKHWSTLVADDCGRNRHNHGAGAVHAVQVRTQGPRHEQERPEQGLDRT